MGTPSLRPDFDNIITIRTLEGIKNFTESKKAKIPHGFL